MAVADFVIGVSMLIVAAITLMVGDRREHKAVRCGLGAFFCAIGLVFGAYGLTRGADETAPGQATTSPSQEELELSIVTTPAPSSRICGDQEGAFSGGLATQDPLFFRPEGFSSGWLSSDPATIVLPDGSVRVLDDPFVLIVEDLAWVQLQGVDMANGKANTYGCWYASAQFIEQDAVHDLCLKKEQGVFGRLFRISSRGIAQIGTTQTASCD